MPETPTVVPAAVFHVSEIVATECIARGWSLWDFAERIGALNTPLTVAAWEFYAVCDPDLRMDENDPMDLERVFGISADFWRRTEALSRQFPNRVAPLSPEATAWYYPADWTAFNACGEPVMPLSPSSAPGGTEL